jgi:hypothetical protein
VKKQRPLRKVIVELTLAKLHVEKIQADLKVIFTVLKKAGEIVDTQEVKDAIAILRLLLGLANRAIAELRTSARVNGGLPPETLWR